MNNIMANGTGTLYIQVKDSPETGGVTVSHNIAQILQAVKNGAFVVAYYAISGGCFLMPLVMFSEQEKIANFQAYISGQSIELCVGEDHVSMDDIGV